VLRGGKADLLVINKSDLAEAVDVDTSNIVGNARKKRRLDHIENVHGLPSIVASAKNGTGISEICRFVMQKHEEAFEVGRTDDS